MAEYFLREGGADDEQIISERLRIRAILNNECTSDLCHEEINA